MNDASAGCGIERLMAAAGRNRCVRLLSQRRRTCACGHGSNPGRRAASQNRLNGAILCARLPADGSGPAVGRADLRWPLHRAQEPQGTDGAVLCQQSDQCDEHVATHGVRGPRHRAGRFHRELRQQDRADFLGDSDGEILREGTCLLRRHLAALNAAALDRETLLAPSPSSTEKGAAFAAPFDETLTRFDQGASSHTARPKVAARTSEASLDTYRSVTLTSGRPVP